ncbi:hypothetical protein ACFLZN_00295, partial [Nanoarchaeota archaeon]
MKEIPFPSQYKKAIQSGKKNITIRINKEVGKYEKGKIYEAMSYAGTKWNIQIKIVEITKTKL